MPQHQAPPNVLQVHCVQASLRRTWLLRTAGGCTSAWGGACAQPHPAPAHATPLRCKCFCCLCSRQAREGLLVQWYRAGQRQDPAADVSGTSGRLVAPTSSSWHCCAVGLQPSICTRSSVFMRLLASCSPAEQVIYTPGHHPNALSNAVHLLQQHGTAVLDIMA